MRLNRLLLIVVMGLILTTTVSAKTVLVLGDSLSAAHGIPLEDGWVTLLADRLQNDSETNHWKVVNASISGETTSGGLARLGKLLDQHQPDLCLIELGANDGLQGLPLSMMRSNLQQMIQVCQSYGNVILFGMLLPPNYGKAYVEQFAKNFHELADQYEIPLVPFLLKGVTEDPGMMQEDRLHPTSRAQPVILETIWEQLEPLIKQK
jgi:acyl-CoA thioesterase-1